MTEQDLIGKNLIELQAMMVPPSEPLPVSLWPETQAWVWLGMVVFALFCCAVIKWREYRKANAYRRAAVKALKAAGDDASAIATILRRAALVAYPRNVVAGLHGEDWLRFLDKSRGRTLFETETGRKMLRAPYCASPVQIEGLNSVAADWVRHHQVEVQK